MNQAHQIAAGRKTFGKMKRIADREGEQNNYWHTRPKRKHLSKREVRKFMSGIVRLSRRSLSENLPSYVTVPIKRGSFERGMMNPTTPIDCFYNQIFSL